jgi:hypothetical protein
MQKKKQRKIEKKKGKLKKKMKKYKKKNALWITVVIQVILVWGNSDSPTQFRVLLITSSL